MQPLLKMKEFDIVSYWYFDTMKEQLHKKSSQSTDTW